MTHVYIAQLKCEHNHCILAAAGEFDSEEAADPLRPQVEHQFEALVASGALNRRCACGSTKLHSDLIRTRFRSMEELEQILANVQLANQYNQRN